MDITSAGNGQCTAEVVVNTEHSNIYGTLHGGFTATVVDVISSMAVLTHPRIVDRIDTFPNSGVSVDLHVSYVFINKEYIYYLFNFKLFFNNLFYFYLLFKTFS